MQPYLCLLLFCLLDTNAAKTQKLWDGEGSDGQWQNEKNWYPDGLPDSTEVVILNNLFVKTGYQVTLPPGPVQTTIESIAICPDPGNIIRLEIPAENTYAPGLAVRSAGNSITLQHGAILVNRSGATSGNPILLGGLMRIEDGARYLHQTIRGNAHVVARLASGLGTERGCVEFDVPGNNSYTVSVSGRTFGRLVLSSKTAGKKNYTGSGNNPLVITDGLVIDDSSRLQSSVNGDILLRGKTSVAGALLLYPSSLDSTKGRQLIFSGDTSALTVGGKLELGPYFRNIIVRDGLLYLNASLALAHPSTAIHIEKSSGIMLDNARIGGTGSFQADSGALIGISGRTAVGHEEEDAIIQTQNNLFHPHCRFVFYGPANQSTGTGFPEETGTIVLDKTNGNLVLSKSVVVNDSLVLLRGKIISSFSESLILKGSAGSRENNIHGWPAGNPLSFVDGPMEIMWGEKDSLYFPIGQDAVFAPVLITAAGTRDNMSTIEAAYRAEKAPSTGISIPYPIKSIGATEHWSIKKKTTTAEQDKPTEILHLSLRENSTLDMKTQPHMIMLEEGAASWHALPLALPSTFNQTMASTPMQLKTGLYTLGQLDATALGLDATLLLFRRELHHLVLYGESSPSKRTHPHWLEQRTTGKLEESSTNMIPLVVDENGLFKHRIPGFWESAYFRVRVGDAATGYTYSNTMYVKGQTDKTRETVFPNPAGFQLNIDLNKPVNEKKIRIIDVYGNSIRPVLISRFPLLTLDLRGLKKGNYWLVISEEMNSRRFGFIKQ